MLEKSSSLNTIKANNQGPTPEIYFSTNFDGLFRLHILSLKILNIFFLEQIALKNRWQLEEIKYTTPKVFSRPSPRWEVSSKWKKERGEEGIKG